MKNTMSNSTQTSAHGGGIGTSKAPRAMIHKQILEAAESYPTAPLEEIADEVSGASPDLVERVLDDYGDPIEENNDGGQPQTDAEVEKDPQLEAGSERENEGDTDDSAGSFPSLDELTDKQRQTLWAIHNRPNATQQELAELSDVTPATINRRINAIDEFEWTDRQEFTSKMFENGNTMPSETEENTPSKTEEDALQEQDIAEQIATLTERVEALEAQPALSESLLDDLDLIHKVFHACMDADYITEEEELRILETTIYRAGKFE